MTMWVDFQSSRRAILMQDSAWGPLQYTLAGPPRRLFPAKLSPQDLPPLFENLVDANRAPACPSPAELLAHLPEGDRWTAMSKRSQAALGAAVLLGEDPQRRLEARSAAALAHQLSLVQHILDDPHLTRVLIADEVGLGKTIEAGMLIKRLLDANPLQRVLYLAPARLVRNVCREFENKLDIEPFWWTAVESRARLDRDRLVVASIHKAVARDANVKAVEGSPPWDVIVVDECHRLSDWDEGGGSPNRTYHLVASLVGRQSAGGRLILMSGTPHQGHPARFENLLKLLQKEGEDGTAVAGRVIYRTKDQIKDWGGRELFPRREVRKPRVVELGDAYRRWYDAVAELYTTEGTSQAAGRAAGWARGQALQWAASSVQAGLGLLVRMAIRRLRWTLGKPALQRAVEALRPYRGKPADEPVEALYERLVRQVGNTEEAQEDPDVEDGEDPKDWKPNAVKLADLLERGVELLGTPAAVAKWQELQNILQEACDEKVVLFAQPVETVTAVARFLAKTYGQQPAVIIGGQDDQERQQEIDSFWRKDGPRFLVSSRAGGEGINLHCARRLIHLDVPWNPMELEQRTGRVHRFGSHRTVLVDTLVIQGTREVDAYRAAREKLRLIVTQVGGNVGQQEFEALFSRVMSVVPPEQLAKVIADAPVGPLDDAALRGIGDLVSEGHHRWNEFHRKFKDEQAKIASLDPGEASWDDLERFLVAHAGAERIAPIRLEALRLEDQGGADSSQDLPAVTWQGGTWVCGDTAGFPLPRIDGQEPFNAGTNAPAVAEALRAALFPRDPAGAAFLTVDGPAPDGLALPCGVFAFLQQTIRKDRDRFVEDAVRLRIFVLSPAGEIMPREVARRGPLVRALLAAKAQKKPDPGPWSTRMCEAEGKLWETLRQRTPEETARQQMHAVWPVMAAVVQ